MAHIPLLCSLLLLLLLISLLCDGCMQWKQTAIMLAAHYGHVDMVELLAKKGGSITEKDKVSELLAYS